LIDQRCAGEDEELFIPQCAHTYVCGPKGTP
jgi:hypothetical protein